MLAAPVLAPEGRSRITGALPRSTQDIRPPHTNSIKLIGQALTFGRNAELYRERTPADYFYKVISGAVRAFRILADGRRQIQAFHAPGEIFGLEFGGEHTHSAEAIVTSQVLLVRRGVITALAEHDSGVARQLWELTATELRHVQNHAMLLIKTARERVVSFLLEMARHCPEGKPLSLPMSRQDIADYLGLTIETVSRTLTSLERERAIALPNSRCIVLHDHELLRRLTS
jgi:CRP/FNR family nitrogen fixation transcriptional regulator